MMYGHISIGLAAKTLYPKAPLGILLIACTALDILTGVFALAGIERISATAPYIPFSHGLFMAALWSIAAFAVAFLVSKDFRMGIILGLAVLSHWVLDFIAHPMGMGHPAPPDLPLFFDGAPMLGLGLYQNVLPALIIEFGLFAAGIVVYLRATKAKDQKGSLSFWLMFAFLMLMPLFAILPSNLMALSCFTVLPLLPFGIWIDRHRVSARDA